MYNIYSFISVVYGVPQSTDGQFGEIVRFVTILENRLWMMVEAKVIIILISFIHSLLTYNYSRSERRHWIHPFAC